MIVIIDDSPTALVVLKNFAGERGLREVKTFTDPIKGLEFLLETQVDAVVLDCSMPGIDGIHVTQRLRESEIHKETPVIVVTGSDDSETQARARVAGATAFMGKPVRMAEFKALLASVLKDGGWPYVDRRSQNTGAPDGTERRAARA
jgi:chemotaxis family two-component system response regulator PixG